MRILITNHRLDLRTGTELYAGELATALADRGHQVALFSPILGELAADLRAAGAAVVDDPRALDFEPEVIHGQHHLATIAALCAHPRTPAVYLCHGYAPWEERPPLHPRILRHAAVSAAFRPWFESEFGIAAESVEVVRNGLDLERFGRVREAADRPARALVFDNEMERGAHFDILERACGKRSIELDAIGRRFGKTVSEPAELLPGYDLVFASGRSAMEAIACGCAVVVMRAGEFGELVLPDRLEYFRDRNFALGSRGTALEEEALLEQIDHYSAAEAAETTRRLRADEGLDASVDQLLSLYATVIGEPRGEKEDPDAESRFLSGYLAGLGRHVAQADEHFAGLRARWEATKARRRANRAELDRAKKRLVGLERFFSRGWLRRRLWSAARRDGEEP